MNNKELLIDFIEYAKSRHVMPILHSNIEPLVDDYLSIRNIGNTHVSSSQPEKNFVQWLTEDALLTTKDILAELRALNAKRDEAKQWLKDNNIEITEDTIQQRVNGCCQRP